MPSPRKSIEAYEGAKARVSYDSETGSLHWVKPPRTNPTAFGVKAGTETNQGYREIWVHGFKFREHNLIWFIAYGEIPSQLDHINGVRNDNRLENLRIATVTENNRCRPLQANNTTGFKGVSFARWKRQFSAHICVDRKSLLLGYSDKADEAAHMYNKAAIEYFGEFAVLNPVGSK